MINRTLIAGAVVMVLTVAGTALAQLDPGIKFHLFENGIPVGEVYVPERAPSATSYVEHWVLYPGYRYPGPNFVGELLVAPIPSVRPYASDAEFFRRAPFPEGSTYIEVRADEYDVLPGR